MTAHTYRFKHKRKTFVILSVSEGSHNVQAIHQREFRNEFPFSINN